jgi:hypothetical protein
MTLAREIDASGEAAQSRKRRAEAKQEKARVQRQKQAKALAKKAALQARLDGIELELRISELERMRNETLDDQIDKWRTIDKEMPAKTTLRRKADKLAAMKAALLRLAKTEHQLKLDAQSVEQHNSAADGGEHEEPPDDLEHQFDPDL